MSDRAVMDMIAELVPAGSRVLDLGCGTGELLAHLQATKGCTGYGVELDDANVLACAQRGVNVIQLNLEDGLAIFEDQSFDVVLQLETLQNLPLPELEVGDLVLVPSMGAYAAVRSTEFNGQARAKTVVNDE